MKPCLLLLAGLLAAVVAVPTPCRLGPNYIDQCQNKCQCQPDGQYACTSESCWGSGKPEEPMRCEVDGNIRTEEKVRYFCEDGIVRFDNTDAPNSCTPGTSWIDKCNSCFCNENGLAGCTLKGCLEEENPILSGGGGAGVGAGGAKRYCGGACAADCGEVFDDGGQCYTCQCGAQLQFGELEVPIDQPCPEGLQQGPTLFVTKICRAQGCTPGATWKVNDGCSTCVCTKDGEAACSPCQREATNLTVTCKDGHGECPQDCGQAYNAEKDCFDCRCGVGEPGDDIVAVGDPCPPGTGIREIGAFIQACGPLDSLPRGDTKSCGEADASGAVRTAECPADCGLVWFAREENCAYCQCGPKVEPGDEIVPIGQECRAPMLPGPNQMVTRVCRAPTREECVPDTVYNIECDICICQANGVPTCTKRDCSLPKFGDLHVCDAEFRQCPPDCGEAGADAYCQHCQCGPRLEEGDITVPIEEECPAGFSFKESQFVTKTCRPEPVPEGHTL
ncbi:uncharacterized protein LOC119112070 [Pollicipes pollicipes]|uniref:uncharacterized protein LOC119112070 n=1 Tax=Pollicipes pollicipes TaxID=41117 RepID=UPI0018857867|nr:uncharacterized protein LOC119112070 [Pollicipes pollicipes]